jgi:hypothetical protein
MQYDADSQEHKDRGDLGYDRVEVVCKVHSVNLNDRQEHNATPMNVSCRPKDPLSNSALTGSVKPPFSRGERRETERRCPDNAVLTTFSPAWVKFPVPCARASEACSRTRSSVRGYMPTKYPLRRLPSSYTPGSNPLLMSGFVSLHLPKSMKSAISLPLLSC